MLTWAEIMIINMQRWKQLDRVVLADLAGLPLYFAFDSVIDDFNGDFAVFFVLKFGVSLAAKSRCQFRIFFDDCSILSPFSASVSGRFHRE